MAKPRAGINTTRTMFEYVFHPTVTEALAERLDVDFDLVPDEANDESIARSVAGATVILSTWGAVPYSTTILDACPDLELVLYGAGSFRGYVTEALLERNPTVCTAVHLNAVPTAEYTLALILVALKDACPFQRRIAGEGRAGWDGRRGEFSGGYYRTKVGILGYGIVSRHLMRLLQSFDMEVYIADDFVTVEQARELRARKTDVDYIMSHCDVVTIHHADVERNRGLVDARRLGLMKPGARLVNTSRGRMIDEEALVEKLRAGGITAYLDVTHPEPPADGHPFYSLPNCFMTPHIAGAIGREVERFGEFCLREIDAWLDGRPFENPVDIRKLEGRA